MPWGRSTVRDSVPGLHHDSIGSAGFVQRVDTKLAGVSARYRWWPGSWIINWGPSIDASRNYTFDDILEDESVGAGLHVTFARNMSLSVNASRDLERFGGIDFWKWNQRLSFNVNTSRRISFGGRFFGGDQVFFDPAAPFLGRGTSGGFNVTLRPAARLQSEVSFDTSRFVDTRAGDVEVFDVKIVRAFTTYQFTDRIQLRNIAEYNTLSTRLGGNLLPTYRVNAGTVFDLAARGESPAAFDRRCIPPDYVAPRSNTAGIFPRHALSGERITGLGATRDPHHGLPGYDDHYQQSDYTDEDRFRRRTCAGPIARS